MIPNWFALIMGVVLGVIASVSVTIYRHEGKAKLRRFEAAADLIAKASSLARQGAKVGSTINACGLEFLKVGEDRYELLADLSQRIKPNA